jgi:predicted heme/steroid binding protein
MPNYVDELFDLFGENSKEYFAYKKKDISCNYFWEDGTRLSAYSDKKSLQMRLKKN